MGELSDNGFTQCRSKENSSGCAYKLYLFIVFVTNVLKLMNDIYKLPALCCFQHGFFQRTFHETQLEQSNFLPVGLFCYSQSLLKVSKG